MVVVGGMVVSVSVFGGIVVVVESLWCRVRNVYLGTLYFVWVGSMWLYFCLW